MSKFNVAGVSTQNGSTKLRFANDFVTRCKVLARNKHTDIKLVELPQAMDKDAAAAYISTLNDFADVNSQAAISAYLSKGAKPTAKAAVVDKKAEKAAKDAARKREKRAADKARAAGLAAEQAEIDAEYAIED